MATSKKMSSSSKTFVKGGNGKMFGKQHAGPSMAGVSYGKSGDGGKFPKGGSGKMFGKQTASTSIAGTSNGKG